MLEVLIAGLSAAAAVASAVAGFLAWQAARSASAAAHKSAEIAEAAERERRWNALTPHLDFTCVIDATNGEGGTLTIQLNGPLALGRLDRVTVTIQDDRPDRGKSLLPGGPTAEQVATQVWGPYRFNSNIENVDRAGRSVVFPDGVNIGRDLVCRLERTPPPSWWVSPADWKQEMRDQPIRLLVECERDGMDPWPIRHNAKAAFSGPPRILVAE